MNYTSGPWKIEKYKEPYNNHLDTFQVTDKDGLIVAKCGIGGEEVLNNARLIAAAPEMYEALKLLKDSFGTENIQPEIYEMISNAIQKVEE